MRRSKFAAKREKGQASLFSFGIGQSMAESTKKSESLKE